MIDSTDNREVGDLFSYKGIIYQVVESNPSERSYTGTPLNSQGNSIFVNVSKPNEDVDLEIRIIVEMDDKGGALKNGASLVENINAESAITKLPNSMKYILEE